MTLAGFVPSFFALAAIQTMEGWQQVKTRRQKLLLLDLTSFSLGGCNFWCTNFTIRSGLELRSANGILLPTEYELGWLVLSMVSTIGGVFLGLLIASRDPVFRNKEFQRHQKATTQRATAWSTSPGVEVKARKTLTLFSNPSHILAGAICITMGMIGMHHAEMGARKSNAIMDVHLLTIAVSGVVEVLAVTITLWAIFRASLLYGSSDLVQAGTSITLGLAITVAYCMTMSAASYSLTDAPPPHVGRALLEGEDAATTASHVSILFCYWTASCGVIVRSRLLQAKESSSSKNSRSGKAARNASSVVSLSRSSHTSKRFRSKTVVQKLQIVPQHTG
ncbi:hypothetical protein FI667_g10162, partial [Globisporangium splendens]